MTRCAIHRALSALARTIAVAVVVCALFAGCSATTKIVRELPPANLMLDCAEPQAVFHTNGELAGYAMDLRSALRLCNNDKAALRSWALE